MGDISTLNPADIESIDIERCSFGCYLVQAANGVVLVTTKSGKKVLAESAMMVLPVGRR